MKSHPLNLSPEMAIAAHEGRKTQHRVIIEPQPCWEEYPSQDLVGLWCGRYRVLCGPPESFQEDFDVLIDEVKCPWKIGDRLLARELLFEEYDLEIKNIRVERVQDITEEDAKAEGIVPFHGAGVTCSHPFTHGFQSFWDSIHGPGAWERNDWVWVYNFKEIEQ